jgi:hypothetical protein
MNIFNAYNLLLLYNYNTVSGEASHSNRSAMQVLMICIIQIAAGLLAYSIA